MVEPAKEPSRTDASVMGSIGSDITSRKWAQAVVHLVTWEIPFIWSYKLQELEPPQWLADMAGHLNDVLQRVPYQNSPLESPA